MYKVMIVDDEPVIRYGLKASIPLDSGTYEFSGAFANGKEALDHFEKQFPDILITDIKMPVMNGLELARQALEIHPHLKVIFVSSYNDFEYVREGLKLGAVDYLLKPTLEPEDLQQLLEKCTLLLEQEQKFKKELHNHKKSQEEHQRKELEQELKQMLSSNDYGRGPNWEKWSIQGYTVLYGMVSHRKELEEKNGYLYLNIKIEEMIDQFHRHFKEEIIFSLHNSDLIIVLPYKTESKARIQAIKEKLENDSEISLSIGYQSGEYSKHFNECFYQAQEACDHRFYDDSSEVHHFEKKFLPFEDAYSIRLKEAVNEGNNTAMEKIKEEWLNSWKKGEASPESVKREAGELLSILFQRKVEISILLQKMDELIQVETLQRLKEIVVKTISQWDEEHAISIESPANHQQLMEKALRYIQQNYTSELTLQKIADYTYISKNYFSLLFKKYMDQNFIDYVISLRVKKAESLLCDTSLKVYEVAYRSGFNDVKYFSKLFKKLTGLTPLEYREKAHEVN